MVRPGSGDPKYASRNKRERDRYQIVVNTIEQIRDTLHLNACSQTQILEQSLMELKKLKKENAEKEEERRRLLQVLGQRQQRLFLSSSSTISQSGHVQQMNMAQRLQPQQSLPQNPNISSDSQNGLPFQYSPIMHFKSRQLSEKQTSLFSGRHPQFYPGNMIPNCRTPLQNPGHHPYFPFQGTYLHPFSGLPYPQQMNPVTCQGYQGPMHFQMDPRTIHTQEGYGNSVARPPLASRPQ